MANRKNPAESEAHLRDLPIGQKKLTLCSLCLCGEKKLAQLDRHTSDINELTSSVIGSAIEVHKELGPGLLENIYEECVCVELSKRGIPFEKQKEIEIVYKGTKLTSRYRIDILVNNLVIVELKACDALLPIHEAQLLTYLKLTRLNVGLLINFNVPVLKEGLKRMKL